MIINESSREVDKYIPWGSSQFFFKKVVFSGPSLKRSFSELRRSWKLCFGYVSGLVGGRAFLWKKKFPFFFRSKKRKIFFWKWWKNIFGKDFENPYQNLIFPFFIFHFHFHFSQKKSTEKKQFINMVLQAPPIVSYSVMPPSIILWS